MNFIIEFTHSAKKELKKHQKSGQKKLVSKIKKFTKECQAHPRKGTGKPERLKFRKEETWSREINKKHRFVYEIEENVIYILSVWGHYQDR